MDTLFALLIMVVAFTLGLVPIAVVIILMGLAGAPGAIMFDLGRKSNQMLTTIVGFALSALGQAFIVGAYAVFVVGLLRWFAEVRPDIPTWPLWIAAFFHSGAVPVYGMKEQPDEPTAQHHSLGLVGFAATVVFLVVAFAPDSLQTVYGWVPFFSANSP